MKLRGRGRAGFIPYITAGDPSLSWTARFAEVLAGAGADAIELGVPFSDPIADGPVIQRAAERALKAKTTLPKILDLVFRLRRRGVSVPIVLFTYYNPVLRMGLEIFARRAKRAGVQGVLVVDLPPEEAREHIAVSRAQGLETVFLASPTTEPERLRLIDRASTGFVYYVSRLGVTGERARLSDTLSEELKRLRRHVRKPVAVGFGISTAAQAAEVARHGDAVVVGSALVKFAEGRRPAEALRGMRRLAAAMIAAIAAENGRQPC